MIYVCDKDIKGPDMAEAAFNTIAEIQRLRDAGIEQKQAEAITLSIHAGVTGGVATKADLDLVRKDVDLVRKDVDQVRTEIGLAKTELDGKIDTATSALRKEISDVRTEIAAAKFDLTWRLVGAVAVLNGLLFAALRYLPPAPPTG